MGRRTLQIFDKRKGSYKEDMEPVIDRGIWMFANGDKFEGEYFRKGNTGVPIRHGFGVHTCPNGTIYSGAWLYDKMHGEGKLEFASGNVYEGGFEHNLFHGYGKFIWSNGSYYEGDFAQNKLQGQGKFVDTEGQQWVGDFNGKIGLALRFHLNIDCPEETEDLIEHT